MLRDIVIHPVLNGYSVQVGCQVVVFEDLDRMLQEIKSYFLDPEATEMRYRSLPNAQHTLVDRPNAVPEPWGQGTPPYIGTNPTPEVRYG